MLVIGDIHGRHEPLKKILTEVWDGQESIVFLGDFNDSKVDGGSMIKVWELIKELFKSGIAKAVQSNHSERLLGHLRGERRGDKGCFGATVRELNGCLDSTRSELRDWLVCMPPILRVLEDGKLWTFAHAYPTEKMSTAINGPMSKNKRVEWWSDLTTLSSNVVVGHYGHSLMKRVGEHTVTIVDCEKELNQIAWFRTTTGELSKTQVYSAEA